jgi:hypothetical protein
LLRAKVPWILAEQLLPKRFKETFQVIEHIFEMEVEVNQQER